MPFIVRSPFLRPPDKPADPAAPKPIAVKSLKRRMAQLAAAKDVLTFMPEEGEAVHFLQTGFFDLVMLVPLLLDNFGDANHVRLSTLSYNGRNLTEMCRMGDSGQTRRLSLLASTFFRNQEQGLYRETCQELRSRGHVVAVACNHAKVITLDCGAGKKLTIEGSANLRSNRSLEQVAVIRHDELCDWHNGWIDAKIGQHPGDGGDGAEAEG